MIAWPHFGHWGNCARQCWQSGAPHAWTTDAIPPQPTHRTEAAAPWGCPPEWEVPVEAVGASGERVTAGTFSGEKYWVPSGEPGAAGEAA